MTKKKLETIGEYIDMPIVTFIEKVTAKSYTEANGMLQLLDMELIEVNNMREGLAGKFAEVEAGSKEYEALFFKYLSSFVVEQKILDRKDILAHIKQMKGVENVMSNLQGTCAKQPEGNLQGTSRKGN